MEMLELYFNQIVGQEIASIGRASNMLWLGIGKEIKTVNRRGEEVVKAASALHIQASWRIVNLERTEIMVASSDFYSPRSGLSSYENFEWDVQGNNRFDEIAPLWLQSVRPVFIESWKVNRWGDLVLTLSNQERLEVFVNASDLTESWRLFHTGGGEHLVMTGAGWGIE